MKLSEFRQIQLEDFPDYNVRIIYSRGLRKDKDFTDVISRYAFFGRWYKIGTGPQMFINNERKISDATGVPKDGDKLRIDSSCKIPVTLLKPRYKIITSRSSQSPDFLVIGDISHSEVAFKVFISDELKVVLCLYEYSIDKDNPMAPDLNDYQKLFKENFEEIADKADTFHPYSNDLYDQFFLKDYSKIMYDFYNKMLPDTMFVSEDALVTGTKALTVDSLCSCLKMLESADQEMRDTALITLASSDYSKCRNILRYLLSKYYSSEVKSMKSKSSAVKWMSRVCDIDKYGGRGYYVFAGTESDMAKDYLQKTSQGTLYYTDEPYRNELHCDDIKFLLKNHDFIKKIPGLTYDLYTANTVANSL